MSHGRRAAGGRVEKIPKAGDYLVKNIFPPDKLPKDAERLFHLALSLAEVATAVENYKQPSIEGGEMDKIPVRDRELVAALLRDKLAQPLGDDALQEIARLYAQLSEGLAALDALDLSHIEPAVRFVMPEAEGNED